MKSHTFFRFHFLSFILMQMNEFCSCKFVSKIPLNNASSRLAPSWYPSNTVFGYRTKKGRVPYIVVRAGKRETVRVIRQQTRFTDRRHVRSISPCTLTSCSPIHYLWLRHTAWGLFWDYWRMNRWVRGKYLQQAGNKREWMKSWRTREEARWDILLMQYIRVMSKYVQRSYKQFQNKT
jgi:hypothetical protein